MRLLDVFSGSQTLRNVFIDDGHEVVSIDNKKYRNSSPDTLIMDFLHFDYTTYHPDHFDVLFFGLPCTAFSKASGGLHFDKNFKPKSETAVISELLMLKCFETITYFNNATFYIENPAGGLCNHPLMKSFVKERYISMYRLFLSQYGFPTPKQTDIFTNNNIIAFFDSFYRKNGRYTKNKFDNLSLKQRQAYPVNFCKMILEWTYLNELSKLPV
jgi:site-specific DNA-cytosine methylase